MIYNQSGGFAALTITEGSALGNDYDSVVYAGGEIRFDNWTDITLTQSDFLML